MLKAALFSVVSSVLLFEGQAASEVVVSGVVPIGSAKCRAICEMTDSCREDPQAHSSYCKSYKRPAVCFGLYHEPNGDYCFEPNEKCSPMAKPVKCGPNFPLTTTPEPTPPPTPEPTEPPVQFVYPYGSYCHRYGILGSVKVTAVFHFAKNSDYTVRPVVDYYVTIAGLTVAFVLDVDYHHSYYRNTHGYYVLALDNYDIPLVRFLTKWGIMDQYSLTMEWAPQDDYLVSKHRYVYSHNACH